MPYRSYSREQDWLLPPSLGELVPADHAVRFVTEFVDQLDWHEIGISMEAAVEGAPRYHPSVLLGAWLYGFMVHVRSSRRLEQACCEQIPFLWLTGGQRPDHVTLWRFYSANRAAMRRLLKETVRLASEVGLVDFALQAIDGSRVAIGSPASLKDREALQKLLVQVETEITAMEQVNQGEPGTDQPAAAHSQHALLGKQELRERIKQALTALESKTGPSKEKPAAVDEAAKPRRQSQAGPPPDTAGKAAKTRKQAAGPWVSATDPEAGLMKGRRGYVLGYNGQVAVDSKSQIIVGADVVTVSNDAKQLVPMLDEAQAMTGRQAQAVVADTGYFEMDDLATAQARGIEPYVPDRRLLRKDSPAKNPYHKEHFVYNPAHDIYTCPKGGALAYQHNQLMSGKVLRVYRGTACHGCPAQLAGTCTHAAARRIAIYGHEQQLQAHSAKMQTDRARQILRQRCAIVEPIFASLREQLGLVRFLVRGLTNVKAEWRLLCTAHNLRKLWKLWWRPRVQAGLAVSP